ncbi:MAG: tRNA uridine-5-carboxymethylaminomethyl(34) synthesis GTPase MnmE, partial [Gammaproteobacteria bacterium]|nr:tRNA uridine-5-carboxymethylaminomethyl(34) synthesis GTPase MnmE [Gammaproteobacteria bacterium]
MLSGSTDTIVAQATPPGQGGVGIIRVSGSSVADVCQTILGNIPSPRLASYQPFKSVNGETLDI